MTKRDRIYAKFGGRCAYCGKPLPERWHMDHKEPICRSYTENAMNAVGRKKGADTEDNLVPACPRCNIRKSMMDIETFRFAIYNEIQMLRTYNDKYRLAEDFGIVKKTDAKIVFYFERIPIERPTPAEGPTSSEGTARKGDGEPDYWDSDESLTALAPKEPGGKT